MIELLLRSDLAVEFTEFNIVLPRAAVFLAGLTRSSLARMSAIGTWRTIRQHLRLSAFGQ